MIKLKDLIKESNDVHEYGCVMLYFNFPEINKIHDMINPDDVYTEEGDNSYGLETEPHTTLLYGLHPEVTLNNIKEVLSKFTYSPCTVYNPSLFNNEKYDVLKFDVKGDNLHKTNEALKEYPYTSNFPKYHPHLTIGYLNPKMGQAYVDMLNKSIPKDGYQLVPQYAVYSMPDGTKHKLKINVNGNINESTRWIELAFIEDTKLLKSKKKITEYYNSANRLLFEHLNPKLAYPYTEKTMSNGQMMWSVEKQDNDPQFLVTLKTKPNLKYWILDFYFFETGYSAQKGLTGTHYLDTLTKIIRDNIIPYFKTQQDKNILFFNAYSGDDHTTTRKVVFQKILQKFINTDDFEISIKDNDFLIYKHT